MVRRHSTVGETLVVEPGRVAWRCLWEPSHCQVRGEGLSLSMATRSLEQHYRTQHDVEVWEHPDFVPPERLGPEPPPEGT